jgi:hypothetical protein
MKFRALLGGFLILSSVAHGDLVLVQRVEGAGQSGEQIIRVKGDQGRCDVGTAISLIVDRKNGETTTLSHAQKGYVTVSPERAKAMMEQMQKARGPGQTPPLVPTGKFEKVGEHACEIFETGMGAVKVTYWLDRAYPDFFAILAQLDVVESGPLSATASGLLPRSKDFPGMPMKMVMDKGGQKVTVTLVSAKAEPVDPAIFQIPPNYKEMPVAAPPSKASNAP